MEIYSHYSSMKHGMNYILALMNVCSTSYVFVYFIVHNNNSYISTPSLFNIGKPCWLGQTISSINIDNLSVYCVIGQEITNQIVYSSFCIRLCKYSECVHWTTVCAASAALLALYINDGRLCDVNITLWPSPLVIMTILIHLELWQCQNRTLISQLFRLVYTHKICLYFGGQSNKLRDQQRTKSRIN